MTVCFQELILKSYNGQMIHELERNQMGEVIEINLLSPDKGTLDKLINFLYEYVGCSKDSIEIKVMDNWQYEGEVKLSDESQLYDLIDTKIIRIQGPCYLGFAGVTSERIGDNYQFDVWMNPNPADEFDNAEFESFKKEAEQVSSI